VNPEKALGVAVAVLGGLNFVFGFLPQYTGGSTSGNYSVYAVGPGYVPILLLIAGLLALAAFVPGSERSRLAVAAVSVGGAVAAVISIGTTSPGTASLGTGLGAILLTIFGIVQAVIAIGGYVVGAGISPRATGAAAVGPAGPNGTPSSRAVSQPAAVDSAAGRGWAGSRDAGAGWSGQQSGAFSGQPHGGVPGQQPSPTGDVWGVVPAGSWQAAAQQPDQGQWIAGQPAAGHAYQNQPAADQPYGPPPNAGQPNAAAFSGGQAYAQPNTGETPSPSYGPPNAVKSYSSPTYADQAHAGQTYFGQSSSAQYQSGTPAPPPPIPGLTEPATGPQTVVGRESPRSSAGSAAGLDPGQPATSKSGNSPDPDQQPAESQSDVVDLAKSTEPRPTAQ
jgi:hypothetical protein